MTKYYKIITEHSQFAYVYNIKNVLDIPSGTRFVAKENEGPGGGLNMQGAFLHFTDNEFDTMLWHDILGWDDDADNNGTFNVFAQKGQIYEIKPLGPVAKERCDDYIRTFQCGAKAIEIVKPIDKAELFKAAIKSFEQDPMGKMRTYPDLNMKETIAAWSKQKRSKYTF
ncbi:MAG: hypothetical protein J6R99_04100 [Alphaproteobacteria bacterium]|nr:hypothetical protein [Alphaproteobacteria bacterium]